MSESEKGTTVAVTSKGQATIPKRFREKLRIETPGRVRFVENERGEIVIRPVERPSELRGALATQADEEKPSATQLLRDERERDERRAREKFDADGREE
jgi:AbrB family looped-hinge helix DNA binding protein